MKKLVYIEFHILTWTPASLQHFNNVFISHDVKTDLFTHG